MSDGRLGSLHQGGGPVFWPVVLGSWMTLVIVASFLYIPAIPGFGATGETARLIVYHVPAAWVAVLAYFMAMVNAVGYLRTSDLGRDRRAQAHAELGTVFCILATLSGAIWSRAAWGAFWNWDPRQTSIVILLMIYAAYFALRGAISDDERRARLSAVYAILAALSVPFLVFVVPRLYPSLHPDLEWGRERVSVMSPPVLVVFLAALVGFTGLYLWMYRIQVRWLDWLHRKNIREGV